MIRITFENAHTSKDRRTTLDEYLGQRVTLDVKGKGQVTGDLKLTNSHSARVVTDSGEVACTLLHIRTVWVYVGGDWVTNTGHSAAAMTERIHVRCSPDDKQRISDKAAKAGLSVGEYVRRRALG